MLTISPARPAGTCGRGRGTTRHPSATPCRTRWRSGRDP